MKRVLSSCALLPVVLFSFAVTSFAQPAVDSWVSSEDNQYQLSRQLPSKFAAGQASSLPAIRVEAAKRYQTMLGLGSSLEATTADWAEWEDLYNFAQGRDPGFDPLAVHASVHTAAYNHTIGTQKTAIVNVANPWEDFHIYAMEWYADRIEVFVDGQKYFTFRNENTGSSAWPFDRPQYLLINLAIGGSWGGQKGINDALFPQRYLIDYVRIYQQR
jgi:hypothetical protein